VGKTEDHNYYLYQRTLGHLTKNCYIFKDVLQALTNAKVLKLCPEQKKVTANMIATSPIQFGQNPSLAPIGVAPIPKRELRVINIYPHNQREKGLIRIYTPQGETM